MRLQMSILGVTMVAGLAMAEIRPAQLRCEYRVNPLGIDVVRPRLSWIVETSDRGQRQRRYQVLAASSAKLLAAGAGDLWDTGKIDSNQTLSIAYAGKPIKSGTRVHWKVRLWDQGDRVSAYSEPAYFEMGLLEPPDWTGKWIADDRPLPENPADFYAERPAPMFRKEFNVSKTVLRARAYVTGLGYYEMRINGQRVGDQLLDPGWTSYQRRVLYSTYDVTELLQSGRNAVGIMVGNGWYNPLPLKMWGWLNLREHLAVGRPRTILQLNVEYTDGTRESIVTDESWKLGDSPIIKNSIYLGEVYDARREQRGWDRMGFEDRGWRTPVIASEPVGVLRAQMQPPIRVIQHLTPVNISEPSPGVYLFDMGQNFAGWVTLKVRGEAGQKVQLRYGELLHADGTLNPMTSVCGQIKKAGVGGPGAPDVAWQADAYICRGGAGESYTPRFTFHGFRYVEVTGYPGRPTADAITGHLLSADVEPAGKFACSNDLLNRIQEMVRRTQISNMFSVQSDCPQRERFGYGGDIVATSEMAIFNWQMAPFYEKAVTDLLDAARPNGGITETAPYVGISAFEDGLGGGAGPIGWGTVLPVLMWNMHQYHGDQRLLEEAYPAAARWMEFLDNVAQDLTITKGIGDHESLAPKSVPVSSTAFYFYNADLLSRIARSLGKNEDANRMADRASAIKANFNRRFLNRDTGQYAIGTQACQAFPLYMDLVPAQRRPVVLQMLVKDIEAHNHHLTTGIFGTKYALEVLSRAGRADVAYRIVNSREFPGWGHMLEKGATTLWEHWEFSDDTFSHNHPMFGSVSEWFYKWLAGIQADPAAVGFDKIIIRPDIIEGLEWVRASCHSVRGPIVSEWKREGGDVVMHIVIPGNTTAMIHLPTKEVKGVLEGGRPVQQSNSLELRGLQADRILFAVGSGEYTFRIPKRP